ncbi:hypothetical protein [Microbacterium indicum]|uniref:aggregation-promoting factor C-terminal-like domain-containing protein n=1 Tax=Microbacterium indicum TaxID=358100 RepID=UPI00041FC6EA|nr:hypothetical protein [Microbacterium indicum]
MTGETPLLTPFPRANHLRLLRKEKERRNRLVSVGVAAAVGIVVIGGGTAMAATGSPAPRFESGAVTLATGQTADDAKSALDAAQQLLDRASGKVDTDDLQSAVDVLSGYEKMPEAMVASATSDVDDATGTVTDAITAYEAEQKKKAEEQAAKEAEEAAAAAEALAEANTVEGAKATATQMAADDYGWGSDQFACLDSLWTKESGWNYQASNASSGAYGIPQALPGSKMGTIASDWETNASTQIAWGLQYIAASYGTPCSAWAHSQSVNWY